MDIHASLFVAPEDGLNVHPDKTGRPIIQIGNVSIHFKTAAKFLELWDHMDAYQSEPVEPSLD